MLTASTPAEAFELLALYREDGINLDQLMALTLSDDHAVQERTWFDAQPWDKTPVALRRRLTIGEVEALTRQGIQFPPGFFFAGGNRPR